jgi:hypothetical protein
MKDKLIEVILTLLMIGVFASGFLTFIVILYIITAFVLMFAWNITMPYLFDLPEIRFIHSICIVIITKILLPSMINIRNGNRKEE